MANAAIELKNITKTFGSVVANRDVNLSVNRGEILSILGENGSGKTTLMNMISGIYFPDSGQIFIDGKEVIIRSPKDAFELKIGMTEGSFSLLSGEAELLKVTVGGGQASFALAGGKTVSAPLTLACENPGLHIFVDRSCIEVFVNGGEEVYTALL